uniref:Uncharacterized protein n=1 Tax=Arundo donax TaxID=35708 RepID=A0A0A8Z570_ARUDO
MSSGRFASRELQCLQVQGVRHQRLHRP